MKIRLLQTIASPDFNAQAGAVIDVDNEKGLSLTKVGAAQWLNPKPANTRLNAIRSRNTIKAYRSDWKHFESWCQERGIICSDPSPEVVASYLEICAESFSFSTIKRRLNAIIAFYREQGLELDRYHPIIRQTMEYARRKLAGRSLHRPHALLIEDVRAICRILPNTTKGIRDRAVILIGFAGGLRGSEIVGLDWNDIERGKIVIRKSKTDQYGYGRIIPLKKGKSHETCPIRALQKWQKVCGDPKSSAIFRRLTPQGKITEHRLSCSAVSDLIKQAVGRIGLIPKYYSSHSLRAGHVTQAAINGASEREIMRTTGHRSTSTLHRYIREAQMHSLPTSIDMLGL